MTDLPPLLRQGIYWPEHLPPLVSAMRLLPGWESYLAVERADDGAGGLHLFIVSDTEDSLRPGSRMRVRHGFLVPAASYNRDTWAAWLFERFMDVLRHEGGEFFQIDGERVFAPHHGNGENPYLVWHHGTEEQRAKRAGDD